MSEDLQDIINEAVKIAMNCIDEPWECLPLIPERARCPIGLIYVKEYPPEVFGGYLVVVWTGSNKELILPRLNYTIRYYTVSGISSDSISILYDLVSGESFHDYTQKGIMSSSVRMGTRNGMVTMCYMSPVAMRNYKNMDEARDAMSEYVRMVLMPEELSHIL